MERFRVTVVRFAIAFELQYTRLPTRTQILPQSFGCSFTLTSRLSFFFWGGGCVSALPTPPTECLPVRDSIVDGLQKVMHPNFAMRSTERFALALESINALSPLNETELYGILNASEESVNDSKLHSDRMEMHILELFGRISIIQLWSL